MVHINIRPVAPMGVILLPPRGGWDRTEAEASDNGANAARNSKMLEPISKKRFLLQINAKSSINPQEYLCISRT